MIKERKKEFSVEDKKLAIYAKALSHPARVTILQLLMARKACICGDIVDEIPLAQSTISQHLKELKEAGLIKGEIDGVTVCYCINDKEWQIAGELLKGFFAQFGALKRTCS